MIGETLGQYRILSKLGEGGMGAVYLGEHQMIGHRAAIKVLLSEYSQNKAVVNRFFNEARATAKIKHPGLVDIFDFGYHPGGAYIAMEYLVGESLAARLHRDPRPPAHFVFAVVRQVAVALGAAHAHGIVHRDVKPDNVFLCPDEGAIGGLRVKVLDFGIAKLQGDLVSDDQRTRTGSVLGTPRYMSPEQCRGAGTVDWRADVYSLGTILFEMVLGRRVFDAEGAGEIIAAQLREPAPSPSSIDPSIPPALDRLILRTLAKKPDERPQSMQELVAELDAISGIFGAGMSPGMLLTPPPHALPAFNSGFSPPTPYPAAMTPYPGSQPGVPTPPPRVLTPPPAPTTLTKATGQVGSLAQAPRRSRRPLAIAVGALAGLVIAAAFIVVPRLRATETHPAAGGGAEPPESPPSTTATSTPVPVPVPVAAPVPVTTPVPVPVPEPVATAAAPDAGPAPAPVAAATPPTEKRSSRKKKSSSDSSTTTTTTKKKKVGDGVYNPFED